MDEPVFDYARAADGAYIAYLTLGEGPIDIVNQPDWFGDIELGLESPYDKRFYRELASFARLILHDRRGTGLSSRAVAPGDVETRAGDILAVLDAVGSARAVVLGFFESGAPAAMLAAMHPERVTALVWAEPNPKSTWSPDFPWGRSEADVAEELRTLERWGTAAYGEAFVAFESAVGNDMPSEEAAWVARLSRHTCTPDVALEIARIWNETDVRGILPAVVAPTLLIAHRDRDGAADLTAHVAELLPNPIVRLMPGSSWAYDEIPAWVDEIRRFIGAERPPVGLDTVLATALFTDIVDSTSRQAVLGDHAWKDLAERHHRIVRDALVRWRGVERDTAGDGFFATFDGPARAIRCALEVRDRVHDLGLEIRAGVHTGECELIDGKVGGVAVSIGSRVAATAGASEVLVSQTVRDLIAGSGLTLEDAGEHELKGVPDRWRLYRVVS
jgi:class 3 adenylate cyclase